MLGINTYDLIVKFIYAILTATISYHQTELNLAEVSQSYAANVVFFRFGTLGVISLCWTPDQM